MTVPQLQGSLGKSGFWPTGKKSTTHRKDVQGMLAGKVSTHHMFPRWRPLGLQPLLWLY